MNNYEHIKDYYKYTNWRYVGTTRSTFNHYKDYGTFGFTKKGIWVVLDNYRHSCFIYGMDVREFLQISENGNYHSFIDHYWDTCHVAYCKSCNGAGKIDWISNITGPQPFEKIRHKYVRDKSKILKFQNDDFLRGYIFAPTKLFKSERICKNCMGSGIHIDPKNIDNLLSYDIDKI